MPILISRRVVFGRGLWTKEKVLELHGFRPLEPGEREQFPEACWRHLEPEVDVGLAFEKDGGPLCPAKVVPRDGDPGKGHLEIITEDYVKRHRELESNLTRAADGES